MKVEKQKQEQLAEFLRQTPYLKNFPVKMINKLSYHLEPVTYNKRGEFVLQEDTDSSTVVFVREGELEIVR